jgi:hypothetical protein
MPSIINFNNRQVIEPGSNTRIIGGNTEAAATASFGKVMIVDTGSGAAWGGGSGVNGQKVNGANAVYAFNKLDDFRTWIRGGILWDIAQYIFTPSAGERGCEQLLFVSGKASTKATLTLTLTNGTIKADTVAEGVGANGVINATSLDLERGYSMKLVSGVNDTAKFILQFYVGTFKGNDTSGVPFDGISASDAVSRLITQSPEFLTLAEINAWLSSNSNIQKYFYGFTVTGTGNIVAADLVTYPTHALFAGATETYSSGALDDALEAIEELDFTFFLVDKTGIVNGKATENTKIFSHIKNVATYEKFMVVGGGKDVTEFDQAASSFDLAAYYDSERVYVVHSDVKKIQAGGGFRTYSTLYHAAMFVGRIAGLDPQVPATWKRLSVDEPVHILKKKERERALLAGVVHLRDIEGDWVVNQEINTLLVNDQFIYPNGTSPEGSVMRIASLLNKEIKQLTEREFVGGNSITSSPADIKAFIQGILTRRTAEPTADNLILSFQNVTVTQVNTDVNANYSFVPNAPVNRLFITGTMLDVSLSA